MNSREEILTSLISKIGYSYDNIKSLETGFAKDMLEVCEKAMEEYAQQFRSPDMAEPGFVEYINESRASFIKHIHSMEWDLKLRTAVDDLLICFDQMKNKIAEQPIATPDMAEALRLKWITLTEDMGRMLSGQRGVSIDKLNKVMNLVQEFVNTLPASLSSPGSGWVKVDYTKPETLPEFGVDVIVYAPEEKDPVIIDHCFKGADGNVYWDWCNNPDTHKPTVTHWQPLPAPPGE